MNETPRKRREDGHGPIAWITRWKVALAVAAALALITGIGVFTLLPRDHEHFTSDGEPEVGDVPREIDHIAWEWDTPDGTTIQEVAPGPAGPIALTDHGAIALDGTTGEELWGITTTDPDIHTLSGVTPGGERTVIFQIRRLDEGALNKVTILDSRTGKIDHRFDHRIEGDTSQRSFTWKDPDPDPRALSDHTWPEATETGLLARDLSDGDVAWDYTPPDGCTIRSQAYAVNLAPYTIASTGDLFVFPEHCGLPEEQDSHETAVESTGRIVALDAATGEPAWPAITDILFRRDSGSDNLGFRTPITLDTEQTAILAHTTSGPTLFDLETGEPRYERLGELPEEEYRPSAFSYLEPERLSVVTESPSEEDSLTIGRIDLEQNRITDEARVEGQRLFPGPEYSHRRPTDSGRTSLSLENGLLISACETACGAGVPLLALFSPWNGDGAEEPIEMPMLGGVNSSGPGLFMKVPGGIVAWRPHGEQGTTRTLIGLA
ncbi:PQQ-binding-like beta-propeller repeat protein [Nocardiopsis alba]|uniref:outer membrane protein assembly factor BamB family protein n=1 Tax=Nocardiopsis alba TaxID=53437 RepID=UPI0034090658